MPGIIGTPRIFRKEYKFLVEIDDVAYAGFQKCEGLVGKVGVTMHREGGSIIADKSPGLAEFDDLVLERGACQDQDLYNWFKNVLNASAGTGLADPAFKRLLDIVQQDRDSSELERYRVVNAWPREFSPGKWDNNSESNRIERVVLAYDYFERVE